MSRLPNFIKSSTLTVLASLLLKLALVADVNAYFLDGETYAGLSIGLLFAGSLSDLNLESNSAIYIGSDGGLAASSFRGVDSVDMSNLNYMVNGYVGLVDDIGIAYELSINWTGSSFTVTDTENSFSFDTLGLFIDFSYDFYEWCIRDTSAMLFAKLGAGFVNMYNIRDSYSLEGAFLVSGAVRPYHIHGAIHDASAFGLGLRGSFGGRMPISDYASISLTLAIWYMTSMGNVASFSAQTETADIIMPSGAVSITGDGIKMLTGALTLSVEVLAW